MTKQTSKKAEVKRQQNSEKSQSSLRQVPSEELKIVAQDGLATEHLREHSPTETKRPRAGDARGNREIPTIVSDHGPPVEDRPLSPNSKKEIENELTKLAAKIKDKDGELKELNRKNEECEKALANVPNENSREYHRKEDFFVLQERASPQKNELILQERLAARERSSDLPVLPGSVSTYCLPDTIPHISMLSHPVCEEYTGKPGREFIYNLGIFIHTPSDPDVSRKVFDSQLVLECFPGPFHNGIADSVIRERFEYSNASTAIRPLPKLYNVTCSLQPLNMHAPFH